MYLTFSQSSNQSSRNPLGWRSLLVRTELLLGLLADSTPFEPQFTNTQTVWCEQQTALAVKNFAVSIWFSFPNHTEETDPNRCVNRSIWFLPPLLGMLAVRCPCASCPCRATPLSYGRVISGWWCGRGRVSNAVRISSRPLCCRQLSTVRVVDSRRQLPLVVVCAVGTRGSAFKNSRYIMSLCLPLSCSNSCLGSF